MFNLPLTPQQMFGPLSICVLSIVLYLLEPYSSLYLVYESNLVRSGEIWRLITGNLLHSNQIHLVLNIISLSVLWLLHGDYYRFWHFLGRFLLCSAGCTLGVFVFAPQLTLYLGLSGVLHGLLVWGACRDIMGGRTSGWLLLLALIVKLIWEQLGSPSEDLARLIEISIATEAHITGAISGGLVLVLEQIYRKYHPLRFKTS